MTCPRCQSTLPTNALYCPFCGDAIPTVPVAPSVPVAVARVVLSLSEVCDAEWHAATVAQVIDRKRTFNEPMDRREILAEVRAYGVALDGGGSRYFHPAACRAVDAAMSAKE